MRAGGKGASQDVAQTFDKPRLIEKGFLKAIEAVTCSESRLIYVFQIYHWLHCYMNKESVDYG